jgi:tetratricopeptide (TPR) repeat protein
MDAQEIVEKGELLFQQGNSREAEKHFLLAIQCDPANKEAHNNLGVIAFSETNHEMAIVHFKNALSIDPSYMDALLNLCDALQFTNSLAAALPILENALHTDPDNAGLAKMLHNVNSTITRATRSEDKESIDCECTKTVPPKHEPRTQTTFRVIHLPLIIANAAIALSKYLNRLGVDSKVISYFRTWLNYQGDINLDLDELTGTARNKKVTEFVDHFLKNEAPKYDIFHFHFFDSLSTGKSFGGWKSHPERGDFWDLEYLKNLGKKIVVSSWGSDVRNNSKVVYYQLRYEGLPADIPYPPLNRKDQYLKIWKFAQYADAVVHGDSEVVKHAPYGTMIPISIDAELFDGLEGDRKHGRDKLSILHAPSNQFYKGTAYVDDVLQRISGRYGDRIEIRKIQGLSHQEAMRNYLGYGAAIDQIGTIAFGVFALEALYLGRTVFTSFHEGEFLAGDPKIRVPVIAVKNQNDFYDRLVGFLDSDLVDNSENYRRFVLDNFHTDVIARQYRELYERIMSGETIKQYVSQEWYKEFSQLLSNQKIDLRNFYPKVTDLLLQRHEFDKLFHELQMGMGLNDDVDLLAKYILALEVTNQKGTASATRRANDETVSTSAFTERYNRAKDLCCSGGKTMQHNLPNQQRCEVGCQ